MPKVSIIIVSYNSEEFIFNCISSVLKFIPNEEVIVLDNCSVDKTVNKLEHFAAKIKLIKSSENLGFSKGSNKAVDQSSGEYLFFLNPDTRIEGNVLKPLLAFYKANPKCGIVAPKLIMPNNEIQPSVSSLPTISNAFGEFILGKANSYSQFIPQGLEPTEVEAVYGAAILIRKELFLKVGGFDEKFFLYYEDLDLCRKIKKIGKKIYYYPKVAVWHLVGGTKSVINKYDLNVESSLKYHGRFSFWVLNLIFRLRRFCFWVKRSST
jgi:N-acetylglucosaminyl-diphospho-decaprenol L-rhamnosyltransferase